MKIVVLDGYTLNPGDLSWKDMSRLGECTVYDRTPAEETLSRMADADIILTNKVIISRSVMEQSPKLKYIGVLATGYNVVDLDAARERQIVVTNIPAYSTDSVAQLTFAHLLNVCHQVNRHAQSVRNGDWANSLDFSYFVSPQMELAGKTMGIIGFGKIGRKVAAIARVFGMNVIFHNRSVVSGTPEGMVQKSLEEVMAEADVLSINCPLTDANREFVNRDLLARMKPTAILINTGRGALIREHDLADALNEGRLAAACLDVLSTEPPHPGNPLLTAQNCYITPHIAWATREARQRLMNIAVENIKAFQAGTPVNRVGV